MSGPNLDLEKPNVIGGLDRLVTNFALSAIAVFPTFWTCIAMPWRLRPLLDRDEPDGRMGILLAPGAFFPLALMVSLLVGAILSTPETVSNNGSFIGPDLAVSVRSAASEGDVWKIIATVMPLYGAAIYVGLVGMVLRRWVGQDWTLRVSLRAAFYVMAVLISWIIFTTAIIDLIWLKTGNNDIFEISFLFVTFPALGFFFWIYFWFFRNDDAISKIKASLLSLSIFVSMILPMVGIDLLIRSFN